MNKSAMLYTKLNSYKALVNKTSGFVRWALQKVNKPYIACSFGKDSAVMLHLVHSINSDIDVRFIRWQGETEYIDNYDEVISQWGLKNLHQIELNRVSLLDKRKNRYNTDQYDSFFVGLRKDESTTRRITLKAHGMFYKNAAGLYRICPLADWTAKDVEAYIVEHQLPTLKSYSIQGFQSRTATRIPREDFGIRHQFLIDLKQRDFSAYQQIINKFPELKSL